LRHWRPRIERLLGALMRYKDGEAPGGLFREIEDAMFEAHAAARKHLKAARDVEMPALKNIEAGAPLSRYLLDAPLVASPGQARGGRFKLGRFMDQLVEIHQKALRLDFKSMGNILALQERISQKWFAAHPKFVPLQPAPAAAPAKAAPVARRPPAKGT